MSKVTSMALPAVVGFLGAAKAADSTYTAAKLNLDPRKQQFDKQQEKQQTRTKFRDKWKNLSTEGKFKFVSGVALTAFMGLGAAAMAAMGNPYAACAYVVGSLGFASATKTDYKMAQYDAAQRNSGKAVSGGHQKEEKTKSNTRSNWIEIQPQTLETVKDRMYPLKTAEKTAETEITPAVNNAILKYLKKERPTKE